MVSRRPSSTIILGFLGAAVVVVLLGAFYTTMQRGAVSASSSWKAQALSSPRLHRIFAYGDSLTAGSGPSYELHPYAPFLEEALKKKREQVLVRHVGLPGWTADNMLAVVNEENRGLKWALSRAHQDGSLPPISVVILLAGTNDLGRGFTDPVEISENIIALHKASFDSNAQRTIAIGIPPSGYQSVNAQAAALAAGVNENLIEFCKNEDRATFFPFPFPFERDGVNWALDTLHFSPEGYRVLGESLAPVVEGILQDLDQKEAH